MICSRGQRWTRVVMRMSQNEAGYPLLMMIGRHVLGYSHLTCIVDAWRMQMLLGSVHTITSGLLMAIQRLYRRL
jgi:hypothetical protein